MKKRRELDALVTNGKLPRRKSKSGHELLRSNDSDSSEVEEFSVPIGNKAGKKWIGLCPCSSCVALLVFIVMTSCLIACGGLIWMHFELKRDLDNLREKLLTVERNQGAPEEFQKYHTQIQDLNRTVHKMKTGDRGIERITKNLTDIATQLNNLTKTTDTLKKGIDDAPYLESLPKQFETLTSTVAQMGSDFQVDKGKVDSLEEFRKSVTSDLEVLKKKVADMENKTQSSSSLTPGREHGSPHSSERDYTQVIQNLQALSVDLDSLNRSFTTKLGALNSSLLLHETRLSLLENFTSQQTSTAGNTDSKDKSDNMLKQLLSEDTDTPPEEDIVALASLVGKVDNITEMVASLGQQYIRLQSDITNVNKSVSSAVSMQGMEEFSAFQRETFSNLEYLNTSVVKLNDNVGQLFKSVTNNRNELTNTTAHVDGILRFLSITLNGTHGSTSQPLPHETDKTLTTSSPTVPTGTTRAPAITMERIHSMEDLEKNFNRWDRQGTGQVDPEDLQDFMADPPTPEQLKPFDADNNGRYSLEEFAEALGFKTDTTKEGGDHTRQ